MMQVIYTHINPLYDELGQLELGEEELTVAPNVFAQIGVIDTDGVRSMWRSVVLPFARPLSRLEAPPTSMAGHDDAGVVFCDLGSGVGNVCMQVLAETGCRKAVGIEVIPSRHHRATEAWMRGVRFFPAVFEGKSCVFKQEDLTTSASTLIKEGVSVVFVHSWMFDDDLMGELTKLVASVPTVGCVITSRPLNDAILESVTRETNRRPLVQHRLLHFSADWNDSAPFHVYTTAP